MSLLLLAYPELAKDDLDKIQAYRKMYDLQYGFAAPHFTIVFAIDDIPQDAFVAEAKNQSKDLKSFSFTVHKASVNKNDFHILYHSFLVPTEGYNEINDIHDELYRKLFSSHLHPTIAYVPHITIGSALDEEGCKKIVDVWDEDAIAISGRINSLDIVDYTSGVLTTIEKIALP